MTQLSKTKNKAQLRRQVILDAHLADIEATIAASRKPNRTPARFLFVDQRIDGSLKLTRAGYTFLQDKHEHWSQRLPPKTSFANYVFLIGASTFPYYIEEIKPDTRGDPVIRTLITFDPMMGVSIKLAGGDFEKLMLLMGV